jgi:hypothetical protein
VRGLASRYSGITRQDEYCLGTDPHRRWLVAAVSDGVSAGRHSQIAATIAARHGCQLLIDQLAHATPGQIDWYATTAAVAQAILRKGQELLGAESPAAEPTAKDVATIMAATVLYAVIATSPADDGFALHAFDVGDTSAWLRDDQSGWRLLSGGKDMGNELASSETLALPYLPPAPVSAVQERITPGSAFVMVTDGIGDPMGDASGDVGAFLAEGVARPAAAAADLRRPGVLRPPRIRRRPDRGRRLAGTMNTWQGLAEHRDALGELEYLSGGGQSTIYRLPSYTLRSAPGPFIYKEYHKHLGEVSGQGLAGVIAVRESLDAKEREWLDGSAIWPLRVVVERGVVTGVIMRLIPDEFFQQIALPSGRSERVPREVQHLLIAKKRCKRLGVPYAQPGQRMQLCAQLSYTVAFLHRRGIVFGDISPRNVLFRLAPSTGMTLVDCDAIRRVGTAAVVGQGNSPDWFPPEGRNAPQSMRTDVYKLGLFIMRVLSPGPGSSVNLDPEVVKDKLDAQGMQLLRRSLAPDPDTRPHARDWYFYLRSSPGVSS